jgi:hypothetical protein
MVWVFGMMGIDGWLLSCAVVMLWTPAPFFWSIQIRCIYFFDRKELSLWKLQEQVG